MGIKVLKILNNDFVLDGEGGFVTLTGIDALAQIIHFRLAMFLGEWFFVPDSGFDWMGLFNQKTFLEKRARLMVRKAILADSRILKINSIDITYDNSDRSITIDFETETTEGLLSGSVTT